MDGLRGAESLRGAAMPWADIVAAAGLFAGALGVRVLDAEDWGAEGGRAPLGTGFATAA